MFLIVFDQTNRSLSNNSARIKACCLIGIYRYEQQARSDGQQNTLLLFIENTPSYQFLSALLINLDRSMGIRWSLQACYNGERKLPQLLTIEVPGNVGGGGSDGPARDGGVLAVENGEVARRSLHYWRGRYKPHTLQLVRLRSSHCTSNISITRKCDKEKNTWIIH